MIDEVSNANNRDTALETSACSESEPSFAQGSIVGAQPARSSSTTGRTTRLIREMKMITCFIRYQIDPFQKDQFTKYAENWARIIPRCGGHLVGYFLPYEGTNDVACGLIAFESLAAYESYRALLRIDSESRENFALAESKRIILHEERTFLGVVPETFGIPATLPD